jgi:hypothetical protein
MIRTRLDQPLLPGFGPAQSRGEPGPPWLRCGGDTIVSADSDLHHTRADCPRCGTWRWLPTRRAGKGGPP